MKNHSQNKSEDPLSPSLVWDYPAILGEGVMWDTASGLVRWLDIEGCTLLSLDPNTEQKQSVKLDSMVSAIAPRTHSPDLIAATTDGLSYLTPSSGTITLLTDPEADIPGNRFNDGKCDTMGNFLFGSMDKQEKTPSGTVYRMDHSGHITPLFGGYVVCNGPAFSPDGRTLYFSNSAGREILMFDYVPETGVIGEPSLFARIPESGGHPDGLTVDAEGYLWCAHWDGARLTRFSPKGKEDCIIEFPVPKVTNCTFGGKNLDTLFVTTARIGMDEDALKAAPLSGSLFQLKLGVTGLPTRAYMG